jgi:hypothetical protein
MADGCPSGYNGSTTGEGCVQCPVGTFLTDFFFLMTIIIFERPLTPLISKKISSVFGFSQELTLPTTRSVHAHRVQMD